MTYSGVHTRFEVQWKEKKVFLLMMALGSVFQEILGRACLFFLRYLNGIDIGNMFLYKHVFWPLVPCTFQFLENHVHAKDKVFD